MYCIKHLRLHYNCSRFRFGPARSLAVSSISHTQRLKLPFFLLLSIAMLFIISTQTADSCGLLLCSVYVNRSTLPYLLFRFLSKLYVVATIYLLLVRPCQLIGKTEMWGSWDRICLIVAVALRNIYSNGDSNHNKNDMTINSHTRWPYWETENGSVRPREAQKIKKDNNRIYSAARSNRTCMWTEWSDKEYRTNWTVRPQRSYMS